VTSVATGGTVERIIAAGGDDAEEQTGSTSLNGSDIELGVDGSNVQVVGLRFLNLTIPPGATISSAFIQFAADEVWSSPNLTFAGQAADTARQCSRARRGAGASRVGPTRRRPHGRKGPVLDGPQKRAPPRRPTSRPTLVDPEPPGLGYPAARRPSSKLRAPAHARRLPTTPAPLAVKLIVNYQ
jgi:hypothetical protein